MPASQVTAVPVIKIDGAQVFAAGMQLVRIRRSLNGVGHLHVRIDPDDADAAKAAVGKPITIAVADPQGTIGTPTFEGEIVGVGIEMRLERIELVLDAYDKAHRLMRQAPTVTHLKKKPSDVISEMAGAAGLTASVDTFGGQYEVYHQWGTSGRCLDELCRTFGAEWFVEGSTLKVRKRPTAPPSTGITLTAGENLRDFAARFSASEQIEKVTVRGWDAAAKQATVGSSNGVNTAFAGKPTTVKATEGRKPAQIWSRLVTDSTAATAVAAGATSAAGLGVLTGHGECDVDSRIVPGKSIKIDGVGPAWNGEYYVTAVEHLLGIDQPFITRFTIGGADDGTLVDLLGGAPQSSNAQLVQGLTIGIVTNNKDSAAEDMKVNRVKVKFPYLSDTDESQWARLVVPGGGKARGLVQLPEVNDEVLVGFEHGDLAKPVVLGGLWNGKDTPPLNSDSAELFEGTQVASRSWVSRKGHRIMLSDKGADESIKVELEDKKTFVTLTKGKGVSVTATDQPIELTNGKATITLAGNGDITIKGMKITIQAQQDLTIDALNIKAKGKANVDIEAAAVLNAKGGPSVAVEASGIVEVKGSLVKVN